MHVRWVVGLGLLWISCPLWAALDSRDQPENWFGTKCEVVPNEDEDVQTLSTLGSEVGELPGILERHKQRLASPDKKQAYPEEFFSKRFDGAALGNAMLSHANMFGAYLYFADLNGAHLDNADLTSSNLQRVDLSGADLRGAILQDADLDCASLRHADLSGAAVGCVYDNSGTHCAHLNNADLRGSKLGGADFDQSFLGGAVFEPESIPDVRAIASARGLELLTYESRPDSLFILRKQFRDAGFLPQEKMITYALNRREAELDGPYERWFKTIAFDWTTRYGMEPGRALHIWGYIFIVCWLIYTIQIHFRGRSGIYQLRLQKNGAVDEIKISSGPVTTTPRRAYVFRLIARELRLIYWAGFFSLTSAFNIGFREIEFGKWLRLLTHTEYELKAEGWTRTTAGLQSLTSLYLMAIWLLTYFGRPFE